MKRILLTAVVALFAFQIFAQVKVSLRAGFSNAWVETNNVITGNDTIGLSKLKGGYHIGFATQLKIKKFFIQPEVLFNSNTAEFSLSKDGVRSALKDRYTNMDIPVIMGYKTGSFRVGAGPVGHVNLNRKSELLQQGGLSEAMKKLSYGYQAGIGLDLWKVQLDLKYEGNFDDFDSFINFDNNQNLSNAPSRVIFTVGYIF